MNWKRIAGVVLLLVSLTFFGCDTAGLSPKEELLESDGGDEAIKQRIIGMGFSEDQIEDYGDFFIAEGDVRFIKEGFFKRFPNAQSRHMRSDYLVRDPHAIRIKFSESFDEDDYAHETDSAAYWNIALTIAVNEWNGLPNTCVHFQIVPSSQNADVIIRSYDFSLVDRDSGTTAGYGDIPTWDGRPGREILLSRHYKQMDGGSTLSSKIRTLAHEMGHVIGFHHTDDNFGTHIEGTPYAEDVIGSPYADDGIYSLMNSGQAGKPYRGFSDSDIKAISILYPPTPVKIQYRAHVGGKGWLPWVENGEIAGTTGEHRSMEAIRIRISGVPGYRVRYRAHVAGIGWMPWVENGSIAGTVGEHRRLEAIQVDIFSGTEHSSYYLKATGHVAGKGWLPWRSEGDTVGTTGEFRQMEAVRIQIFKK